MKKLTTGVMALLGLCVAGWLIYVMVSNTSLNKPDSPHISVREIQSTVFPIGLEVRAEQKLGKEIILLSSRVSKDPKGYLYYYRIEYTGTNTYLYRWEILEKVLGRDEILLDLEPGSVHQFRVVWPQLPVLESGKTEILRKENIKDNNFSTSIWIREKSTAQAGPVPNAKSETEELRQKQGIK